MYKIKQYLGSEKAFTLVEAVVAIVIIGVIGVIMSDVLTRAFDNTQKTNLISNIQQNGQAALTSFEDTIRYSEFVCIGGFNSNSGGTAIPINTAQAVYYQPRFVVYKDGRYIRFRMIPESGSVNGYLVEDFPAQPALAQNASDLCLAANPIVSPRKITNDTMISLKQGSITLLSNPVADANPEIVGTRRVSVNITFSMGAAAGSPTSFERQIGANNEIVFQTTAQFR